MPLPSVLSSVALRFPLHLPRRPSARALHHQEDPPLRRCLCCGGWGRRPLLLGAPLLAAASFQSQQPPGARATDDPSDPLASAVVSNRPRRPDWYEALYARAMHSSMGLYESAIAGYKDEIFKLLRLEDKKVLEIGIGTGPNLKYYAGMSGARVYGVDPNRKMEKYVREAAVSSGLPPDNFKFLQGIAEALPVKDNSMDAVIGTLVLCSVSDVDNALREVKRVLKPGGIYLFIEHVAAQDGSFIRLIQTILDPLQQFVSDGCHLTRQTGKSISEAGFSNAQINMVSIPKLFIFGPHVYGFACK